MRRILLTDLDGTLVRFDTFKFWLLKVIARKPFGFLSYFLKNQEDDFRGRVKMASMQTFEDLSDKSKIRLSKKYAEEISRKLPTDFWYFVDCFKPTHILLLSASPAIYVEQLGLALGVDALGTEIIQGRLHMMKGENKRKSAKKYLSQFSNEDYVYATGNTVDDISFMSLANSGNFIHFAKRRKNFTIRGYSNLNWTQLRELFCNPSKK